MIGALREIKEIQNQVEYLLEENRRLKRALEIYAEERKRFAHSEPEMTGFYFLTGGYGEVNPNDNLPEYVSICPAYGCDFTISYKRV